MHEVQFMSRKAQFMKSQISIHAESNSLSLIVPRLNSLYHIFYKISIETAKFLTKRIDNGENM